MEGSECCSGERGWGSLGGVAVGAISGAGGGG